MANKSQTQKREDRAVRRLLQMFRAGEPLYLEFLPLPPPDLLSPLLLPAQCQGSPPLRAHQALLASGFLLSSASEEIRREEPEVPSPPLPACPLLAASRLWAFRPRAFRPSLFLTSGRVLHQPAVGQADSPSVKLLSQVLPYLVCQAPNYPVAPIVRASFTKGSSCQSYRLVN